MEAGCGDETPPQVNSARQCGLSSGQEQGPPWELGMLH